MAFIAIDYPLVQNLDEISDSVESFEMLERFIRKGDLLLEREPLGLFLELLRYADESIHDISTTIPSHINGEKIHDVCKRYNLPKQSPASYLDVGINTLKEFVQGWYNHQEGRENWNPPDAPITLSPLIEKMFRENTLTDALKAINLAQNSHKPVIYPCTGWALAAYIRANYAANHQK